MMKMHSKYDNMHEKYKNGALKCTENHVIISKYCMLSYATSIVLFTISNRANVHGLQSLYIFLLVTCKGDIIVFYKTPKVLYLQFMSMIS